MTPLQLNYKKLMNLSDSVIPFYTFDPKKRVNVKNINQGIIDNIIKYCLPFMLPLLALLLEILVLS
jgi:hypothetical protein